MKEQLSSTNSNDSSNNSETQNFMDDSSSNLYISNEFCEESMSLNEQSMIEIPEYHIQLMDSIFNNSTPINTRKVPLKRKAIQKKEKKSNHWNQQEAALYSDFCKNNYFILSQNAPGERKANKIFVAMAEFIKTRNSNQCRSHHQKCFPKEKRRIQSEIPLNQDKRDSPSPIKDIPSYIQGWNDSTKFTIALNEKKNCSTRNRRHLKQSQMTPLQEFKSLCLKLKRLSRILNQQIQPGQTLHQLNHYRDSYLSQNRDESTINTFDSSDDDHSNDSETNSNDYDY